MGNIDDLLAADEKNVWITRACLEAFRPGTQRVPNLLDALDTAAGMYHTFGRVIGQNSSVDQDLAEVAECGRVLGAADSAALKAIRAAPPASAVHADALKRLDDLDLRLESRAVRGIVYTQIARAYIWGFADIMRMRVTPAIGYQRLQAEGFGLLCVMRDSPRVALEWREIAADEAGKEFFRKYQRRIMDEIAKADLIFAYEQGSGVALHLRFAGAVYGLSFKTAHQLSRVAMTTELSCQELRAGAPHNFILQVLGVLQTQVRILAGLTRAFPEAMDAIWSEQRLPSLQATMAELWARVPSAFPQEFADWQARHGPLPRLGP